jgi:hypothetical protein
MLMDNQILVNPVPLSQTTDRFLSSFPSPSYSAESDIEAERGRGSWVTQLHQGSLQHPGHPSHSLLSREKGEENHSSLTASIVPYKVMEQMTE